MCILKEKIKDEITTCELPGSFDGLLEMAVAISGNTNDVLGDFSFS